MKSFLLSIGMVCALNAALAQLGQPDFSFGNKGVVQTDFGSTVNVYMNDCRQVLPLPDGSFYMVINMYRQAFIMHRFADGSLDKQYGNNGYSDAIFLRAATAVMQADGKIVVGGSFEATDGNQFGLARFNKNGSLDKTYGEGGMQTTDFPGSTEDLSAMAIQPDGKVVAAGTAYTQSDNHTTFALIRYTMAGKPDKTFSQDGMLTAAISAQDAATGLDIQTDGKLLVGGYSNTAGIYQFAAMRFFSDGMVDSSFSDDGIVTIGYGTYSVATSMGLQVDGKIVMGGFILDYFNRMNATTVKLDVNGRPDNTFSGDGIAIDNFSGIESSVRSLAAQPDGKILIAGYAGSGQNRDFFIARYNPDATLDAGFGIGGFLMPGVQQHATYPTAEPSSLVLLPDASLIVAGFSGNPGWYTALHLQANGTVDKGFGMEGILRGYRPAGQSTYNASALQPDGKLITVGQGNQPNTIGSLSVIVARYNKNGSLDKTFSGDGKLTTDYTYFSDASAVTVQPDGKIVIAGNIYNGTNTDFLIIRLNTDGSPDLQFGNNGKQLIDFGRYDQAKTLALQSDGKIIVGGSADSGTESGFALVRLTANGNLDNSFAKVGKTITPFPFPNAVIASVLVQADGKIVAAGNARQLVAAARYNTDGSPDTSFDADGLMTMDFDGLHPSVGAAALTPEGKIYVTGGSEAGFILARFGNNGALDNSFANHGKLLINFGWYSQTASALVLQPDGKIILGGTASAGYLAGHALARVNADGSLDTRFGTDGKLLANVNGEANHLLSLSLSGNRLYAAGNSINIGQLATVTAYRIHCSLAVNIPDAFALNSGVIANTVYPGYKPAETLTLTTAITHGEAPYQYVWSNGITTSSNNVHPTVNTLYQVAVTDARGCSGTASTTVQVLTVTCGKKMDKVLVCSGKTWKSNRPQEICIDEHAVPAALRNGYQLGSCTNCHHTGNGNNEELALEIHSNPSNSSFEIFARSAHQDIVTLIIWDGSGRLMETMRIQPNNSLRIGAGYRPGIYFYELRQGTSVLRGKLVKQVN